ncbi:uncharacterized protein TRAVEDRAFT_102031, partial [Trametes versicolor FP-101664 SS1]|uniref:uncharacterized protein n=1 Tax=Trametes versicolor (strain FP-101664) TaxID=717944 RepID=UPI00046214BC
EGQVLHGATRLARLILPDTAYLIWVLRCERVIGDREVLPGELEDAYVERRWLRMVSNRLQLDCALTSKRVAAKRLVPPTTVCATWEGTLQEEDCLPADW